MRLGFSSITVKARYKAFKRLDYKPMPSQTKFHNSTARFRTIAAASRCGKSTGAAYELMVYAHVPGLRIWCVGPTYELANKVFRIVWRKMVEELKYPTIAKSNREKDKRFIHFAWDTVVELKSCHKEENLLGDPVDFMVIDEASRLKYTHWEEYIRLRMSDRIGGVLSISSTKGVGGMFYDLWKRGNSKDPAFKNYWSCTSNLFENTSIAREEIAELKATMSPEAYRQEVLGEFVAHGGSVYKDWSASKHVNTKAEFKEGIPFFLALDFGKRNPTAILFIQQIGEDNYNVFDEYYMAGKGSFENALAIKGKIAEYLKRSNSTRIMTYHDPSGADQACTYKSLIPGLMMIHAINDIFDGINTVIYYLGTEEGKDRPRLQVHPRCTNLCMEMGEYHYSDRASTTEVPVAVNDHTLDALRYFLHTKCPIRNSLVDLMAFDNSFAEETLLAQEMESGYIDEIVALKTALISEEDEAESWL